MDTTTIDSLIAGIVLAAFVLAAVAVIGGV